MPATSPNTPQRHTRANQDQLKLSGIARAPPSVRALDLGEESGIDPYILDCANRRPDAEVVPLE